MTIQVLFVQGGGEGTHDEWDNRLVASLTAALGAGYDVRYPPMPEESNPDYRRWKEALAAEFDTLAGGAMVVGHSIGATILIAALAADPPKLKLGGVFLVAAPFIGSGGWPGDDDVHPMENLGAALPDGVPVHLYHGAEDDTAPVAHLDLYAKAIPQAVSHRLAGRDHQLNDDLKEVARDIRTLS